MLIIHGLLKCLYAYNVEKPPTILKTMSASSYATTTMLFCVLFKNCSEFREVFPEPLSSFSSSHYTPACFDSICTCGTCSPLINLYILQNMSVVKTSLLVLCPAGAQDL